MGRSWISFVNRLDPNPWKKAEHGGGGVLAQLWRWGGRRVDGDGDADGDGETPKWPIYELGTPLDIVWDANVTGWAFLEKDTYGAQAMELINDAAVTVFDR